MVNGFSFPLCLGDVPTLEPLRYITPDIIGNYAVSSIENALWSTLLPVVRNICHFMLDRGRFFFVDRTGKMLLQYLSRRVCLDLLAVLQRKGSQLLTAIRTAESPAYLAQVNYARFDAVGRC